jgi:hypothetical protein
MRPREEPTRQEGALHNDIFEATRLDKYLSCYTLLQQSRHLQRRFVALRRINLANLTMYVHRANKNNWNAAGNT